MEELSKHHNPLAVGLILFNLIAALFLYDQVGEVASSFTSFLFLLLRGFGASVAEPTPACSPFRLITCCFSSWAPQRPTSWFVSGRACSLELRRA